MSQPAALLVCARAALADAETLWRDPALLIRGGRIERVGLGAAAARRLARGKGVRRIDLAGLLTPGLVNAHAHLELTALDGRIRARRFEAWVGELLPLRASTAAAELAAGIARGAEELLAGGTTLVGDNDALGLAAAVLRRQPLRVRLFREALDGWDEQRSSAAMLPLRDLPRGARLLRGIAPHAPFTVSPTLARELARLARRRRLPLSIHFAESEEERRWLLRGQGPFARWLPSSPRCEGLDLLERAGLLGPRTLLVHGNLVSAADRVRIAGSGASLVHCPGSHAFFRRQPFDFEAWRAAGVNLALGTDSAASNQALDMRRELALAAKSFPGERPRELFRAATIGGARALCLEERLGWLGPKAAADLVQWPDLGVRLGPALETLVEAIPRTGLVFVGGRVAWPLDGRQQVLFSADGQRRTRS